MNDRDNGDLMHSHSPHRDCVKHDRVIRLADRLEGTDGQPGELSRMWESIGHRVRTSTVFWALGLMVTILGGILSFIVYQNATTAEKILLVKEQVITLQGDVKGNTQLLKRRHTDGVDH